jgi:uncharacterized Tic20 family protein
MASDPTAPPRPPPPAPLVLPGNPTITGDDRLWGMLAHVLGLASSAIGGLSFIGPLIVYLVKKDKSAFIAYHAREALNFNISLLLYMVAAGLLYWLSSSVFGLLLIGIPIFGIVMMILAAPKANQGLLYRYPLSIRFIK